jgi:hypothetical protein
MANMDGTTVWLFSGRPGVFPGGVFSSVDAAERWIAHNALSGVLTAYPLDQGCFDWAVANQCTGLSAEKLQIKSSDPAFIAGFTTAAQDHFHYENGVRA